jgi:hypothetical protein
MQYHRAYHCIQQKRTLHLFRFMIEFLFVQFVNNRVHLMYRASYGITLVNPTSSKTLQGIRIEMPEPKLTVTISHTRN